MLNSVRSLARMVWIGLCALVGAAIGAVLFGLLWDVMPLMIIGGVVGFGLGALFGRFVTLTDVLAD